MKRKTDKGFTLIELMVVISIISLLSSMMLAGIKTARDKATDTSTVQAVRQISIAVQSYFYDKNRYPPTVVGGFTIVDANGTLLLPQLINGGYLPTITNAQAKISFYMNKCTAVNPCSLASQMFIDDFLSYCVRPNPLAAIVFSSKTVLADYPEVSPGLSIMCLY